MIQLPKRLGLVLLLLIIGLASMSLFVAASRSSVLAILEDSLKSQWYSIIPADAPDDRIVLVEIDDRTLDAYYPLVPLPRSTIALLVSQLMDVGHAQMVVLDLSFEGPATCEDSADYVLSRIIESYHDRVVTGMFLATNGVHSLVLEDSAEQCIERLGYEVTDSLVMKASASNLPPATLLCASSNIGHNGLTWGASQIPFQAPAFINAGQVIIPALAIDAARVFLGLSRGDVRSVGSDLYLGEQVVRLSQDGDLKIRFRRLSGHYPAISAFDALDFATLESLPNGDLTNKVAIVGVNSWKHYSQEMAMTPFGYYQPSMRVHAGLISQILRQDYVVDASPFWQFLLHFLVIFLLCLTAKSASRGLRFSSGLIVLGLILITDFALVLAGIHFVMVPIIGTTVAMGSAIIVQTFGEQRRLLVTQDKVLAQKDESLKSIDREMRTARTIQEHLLPAEIPKVDGFDIFGYNLPASNVSGDFFDLLRPTQDLVAFTIGDVSGKGITASLLMATVQAAVRAEAKKHAIGRFSCTELVQSVNDLLVTCVSSGQFVTFFFGLVDTTSDSLRFVNSGHSRPILIKNPNQIESLGQGDLPLGLFQNTKYITHLIEFKPDSTLVLYSDGVTEAMNVEEDFFGEERLEQVIRDKCHLSARELVGSILSAVDAFRGNANLSDDITLLVVRRQC